MGFNVFFNFQLTKRRSKLLYKIRQLKKSGQISKFYSDENGMLTVIVKNGGTKEKVTYFNKKRDGPPFTFTEEEMEALVSNSSTGGT